MNARVVLLVLAGLAGFSRAAAAACPEFDPQGLRPGMTLAEARGVLDAAEDGLEVAAVADGFETTSNFRKSPARIGLIFPGKVTGRSKVGLAAVRSCVPIATFDGATFAERLRERFGEPTAGAAILAAGMSGGEVRWSDPACAIDVRAWRKGSWYDPASEAWCVEQRVARAVEPPPAAAPPAPVVAAAAPPVVAETAVERPADIATRTEPLPEPVVAPVAESPVAESPAPDPEGIPAATAPVLLSSVPPRYPELLRQRRLRANVVVRASIGTDGAVQAVEIVSCDRPGFGVEERVRAALRQWRYRPATQNGVPVVSEIQIPFEFE